MSACRNTTEFLRICGGIGGKVGDIGKAEEVPAHPRADQVRAAPNQGASCLLHVPPAVLPRQLWRPPHCWPPQPYRPPRASCLRRRRVPLSSSVRSSTTAPGVTTAPAEPQRGVGRGDEHRPPRGRPRRLDPVRRRTASTPASAATPTTTYTRAAAPTSGTTTATRPPSATTATTSSTAPPGAVVTDPS
jgi:hypothetical protein